MSGQLPFDHPFVEAGRPATVPLEETDGVVGEHAVPTVAFGGSWSAMLLGLAYLTVSSALAVLRLLPMNNRDKDVEILALPSDHRAGAPTGQGVER
jgi:hypothetical protein